MTLRVQLTAITFDAGTQVRAALDQDHVAALTEALRNGDAVPPICLFNDGNTHYIADGFHRFMAATRLEWREIDATVQPGSKADALWFALGANRTNGKNMTPLDKRHAIELALKTWPDRSQTQLAEQIGCDQAWVSKVRAEVMTTHNLPSRVTGKDGKSYPASRQTTAAPSKATPDKSPQAVAQRRTDIRDMATRGHSTRQIAAALNISEHSVASIAKKESIYIHADRVVGKSKRHNSTRIVQQMVMDAENLTADVNLIDFSTLDAAQLPQWLSSLNTSRDKLSTFIRRLKEQQKHGEAA